MVTRRGAGLLTGAALAWLASRALGIAELAVIAVAAGTLVVAAAVVVHLGGRRIAVRRRLAGTRARPGQPVEVAVDLRNDGWLRSPPLVAEDGRPHALRGDGPAGPARLRVPGIPAHAVRTVRSTVIAPRRGVWPLGPLRLSRTDPFGIVRRTRHHATTSRLIVYPQVQALPPGPRLGAHAGTGGPGHRRLLGGGDEFHTVREYRTGDDLRHVHWASTARRQRLMVRQYEQAWSARATVLLDTRAVAYDGPGDHDRFEAAVSAAASVLADVAARGYESRLVLTDGTTGTAAAPLEAHLERLARAQRTAGAGLRAGLDALGRRDGLLVAVLGAPPLRAGADPEVRALIGAGGRFGTRVALITDGPDGEALATLLRGARWRATTLADGLAPAWGRILAQSARRLPA